MRDQFGRQINYLRISVTDRCNLRCMYCMPEDGIRQVRHEEILTYDEILQVAETAARLGIEKVRITGGEPLVRKNVDRLVAGMREINGIREIALTTNGILLKQQMNGLAKAGIHGINVSLDTMDPKMYARITRGGKLGQVLEGIEEVLRFPSVKLKINCVPVRGMNENQWCRLAEFAKTEDADVRFIEMMPLGMGKQFPCCTQQEVLYELRKEFGREMVLKTEKESVQGPAWYTTFSGFRGRIGFISAMSHKFCPDCNRIRLTAEGLLKPCLQYAQGTDLRTLIRDKTREHELEEAVKRTVYCKPACHHFETGPESDFEQKDMFRIGG